jgi:hypothetical protein
VSYNKLGSIRKFLIGANDENPTRVIQKKIRYVEKLMNNSLSAGVKMKRRVPNTGNRVAVDHVYKDTPTNRKHNRVGQTYQKFIYEGAEYEEIERKRFRKYKKTGDETAEGVKAEDAKPKRRNIWIEAMSIAKTKLNAPALSIVYKEVKDPKDENQVFGHRVYLEALKQMKILKGQMKTADATAAEAAA